MATVTTELMTVDYNTFLKFVKPHIDHLRFDIESAKRALRTNPADRSVEDIDYILDYIETEEEKKEEE